MSLDKITTPSTEDSIPSAPHNPLRRKRPLRTYGRQSREDAQISKRKSEATPTLKTKVEKENIEPPIPSVKNNTPPPPPKSPEPPQKPVVSRGSILSYFRPLPPPPPVSETPLPELPSEATTPPSSPRPEFRPRKRRRLTTRPRLEDENAREACLRQSSPPPTDYTEKNDDTCIVVRQYGDEDQFSERSTPSSTRTTTPALSPNDRKKRKQKAKEMVQTVLSLSVNKDPGIIICKDCGILYNPLNEKDRKEHKRRHAAHVRSLGKSGQGTTAMS
ncbi:hypothetical protein QBC35DRAFT_246489 [Podospora australis]|uniref:N-acetyltransferase ESCO zinc-finger domain-containing protein n=1 Tax=Podospora australis TaxID=1536484 RepID=A0AAN6X2T3_9PEZI|nr:hypothetical protein QBC35DRAFT_246489 [Podospora australis]